MMNSFFIYDKEYYMPGEIVHDQQLKLENYPTNVVSGDMSTITDSDCRPGCWTAGSIKGGIPWKRNWPSMI